MEENARWRHSHDASGYFLWNDTETRLFYGWMYIYAYHICAVNLKKIPKPSAASFDFMHFVLLLYVVQPRVFCQLSTCGQLF